MAENYVSYNNAEALTTKIGNKLRSMGSAYAYKGTVTFANLPASLTASMDGNVYNVSNDFTTDNRFIEGAGKKYSAGTNVAVANVGTAQSPTMMFDVIGNFIDLSLIETELENKVDKVTGKGLSTNDYDNTAKGIVNNIQNNVKANTQLIKDTVGRYGKNLLNNTADSQTINGVELPIEFDKSITANGTASADVALTIGFLSVPKTGKYKLSGITNGSDSTYYFTVSDGTTTLTVTEETEINLDATKTYTIAFNVKSGYVCDNLKVYPMLINGDSIIDNTYEPYHYPVDNVENAIGAKNLTIDIGETETQNGITCTRNNDKSYTISGTNDGTPCYFHVRKFSLPKGKYYALGGANGGGLGIYHLNIRKPDGGNNYSDIISTLQYNTRAADTGLPTRFVRLDDANPRWFEVIKDYEELHMVVTVGSNVDITEPITFYPQIQKYEDELFEYSPVTALTNEMLTHELEASKVIANPTGASSTDLTKLQVGEDIYNIPSGGSGTTVIPNPTGTATENLTKVQIWSDIYNIPDTTYSDATTSASGLMPASDKSKLNGIDNNANNYSLPTAASNTKGGVKIGNGLSISNEVLSVPNANFSTSEVKVGTWTDGKPVYKKTWTGTAPTVTTDGTEAAIELNTGASVKEFVSIQGLLMSASSKAWHMIPATTGVVTNGKLMLVRLTGHQNDASGYPNKVRVVSNTTTFNNATYKVTAYYTKTTD